MANDDCIEEVKLVKYPSSPCSTNMSLLSQRDITDEILVKCVRCERAVIVRSKTITIVGCSFCKLKFDDQTNFTMWVGKHHYFEEFFRVNSSRPRSSRSRSARRSRSRKSQTKSGKRYKADN